MSDLTSKVRLSEAEIKTIQDSFLECFFSDDHLWIFGSRVDMGAKGGDIDLYIETSQNNLDLAIDQQLKLGAMLNRKLGEQKIDIVLNVLSLKTDLLIYNLAKSEGVQLL